VPEIVKAPPEIFLDRAAAVVEGMCVAPFIFAEECAPKRERPAMTVDGF